MKGNQPKSTKGKKGTKGTTAKASNITATDTAIEPLEAEGANNVTATESLETKGANNVTTTESLEAEATIGRKGTVKAGKEKKRKMQSLSKLSLGELLLNC